MAENRRKAFMGVSIRNPFYSKEENILKAIKLADGFDEFLIFVVDNPYRLSLQAFKDIPPKEALKEGTDLKNFLTKISKPFEKVKGSYWSELEDDEYKKSKIEVKNLERRSSEFSKLIEDEFTGTVLSQLNKTKESYEQKKELCKEFIIEEVTMFISLFYKSYKTRISKYERSKTIDYFLKTKGLAMNHIIIG
ncbi:MAG: hypothetical protein Q7J54_06325 [Candidatus Woesearchaeota archaeon]|nr:hypothetical protein [Candidatus Woesearchaeota archaeon]